MSLPAASSNIDWANLGTDGIKVNGHIISEFSTKTGKWSEPKLCEDPYIRIHGLASSLNYAQQAYEALKATRSANNESISLFRAEDHAARLSSSLPWVMIPDIPKEHFVRCVQAAVAANATFVPPSETGGSMYIRPVVFGCSPQIPLVPSSEYIFAIYVQPFMPMYKGIRVPAGVVEHFDRSATRGTGAAKIGGNYAPVMRVMAEARKKGFGITLHLDSQTLTMVEEFSSAGFLGIKVGADGVPTLLVPNSPNVLHSITSDSVVKIAQSWGWKVENRPIPFTELSECVEIMACGTAVSLVPIASMARESTGDKFTYTGMDFCTKLNTTLREIQSGVAQDTFGWCIPVTTANLLQ